MLIRAEIPIEDTQSGIIQADTSPESPSSAAASEAKAKPDAVRYHRLQPKGGVGKTTIAVNVAALLQVRKNQQVLLVDCDTVTGHVASSLGMESTRTVADAWTEDLNAGGAESFAEIAAVHQNGVSVLVMAESPLHTEILDPKRVAEAITTACRVYDWVVVDMHPDYGPLNQVIFERADKIIVPVTPDVPAIRAAVQFREVAVELEIRERLAMVVNRANSGVSVATWSGPLDAGPGRGSVAGMLFVRAANEGRSAVERFPKEKVIEDIETLCDRLMATRDSGARSPARASWDLQRRAQHEPVDAGLVEGPESRPVGRRIPWASSAGTPAPPLSRYSTASGGGLASRAVTWVRTMRCGCGISMPFSWNAASSRLRSSPPTAHCSEARTVPKILSVMPDSPSADTRSTPGASRMRGPIRDRRPAPALLRSRRRSPFDVRAVDDLDVLIHPSEDTGEIRCHRDLTVGHGVNGPVLVPKRGPAKGEVLDLTRHSGDADDVAPGVLVLDQDEGAVEVVTDQGLRAQPMAMPAMPRPAIAGPMSSRKASSRIIRPAMTTTKKRMTLTARVSMVSWRFFSS